MCRRRSRNFCQCGEGGGGQKFGFFFWFSHLILQRGPTNILGGPPSTRQGKPFQWRFTGGPMMAACDGGIFQGTGSRLPVLSPLLIHALCQLKFNSAVSLGYQIIYLIICSVTNTIILDGDSSYKHCFLIFQNGLASIPEAWKEKTLRYQEMFTLAQQLVALNS